MDENQNSIDYQPSLKDLIDIPAFQTILDGFSHLTGIPTAILELNGKILITSGWQTICTQFHRQNEATARRCLESDTALSVQLKKGEKYNVYKCKNGLVDVAVPIVIDDIYIGNLFAGQFFFESPDMDFFTKQAQTYGFELDSYLDALSKIPIVSSETIQKTMAFLSDLTVIISSSGIDKKKLIELNKSLEQRIHERTAALEAEVKAREIEQRFTGSLINSLPGVMYVFNHFGRFVRWNKNFEIISGYTADQISDMNPLDFVAEHDKAVVKEAIEKVFHDGSVVVEADVTTLDGQIIPHMLTGYHFSLDGISYLVGVGLDISDRVKSEKEKETLINRLKQTLSEVKKLSGFIPICASCKKIRDDEGYWKQIEAYIRDHSEAEFSHSICPDCAKRLYPFI